MDEKKKKVVVMGGGNGSAVILRALKPYADQFEISAIISVADSGRTSGIIRKEFTMIPPSDSMRAMLALSRYDYQTLRDIFFTNRITDVPGLEGHNLGSLFLAWGTRAQHGDVLSSFRALEELLQTVGRVYPVTTEQVDLCVELSDTTVVRGEGAIDEPSYDRALSIKRAWLEPEGTILPQARDAIINADVLTLGPSSIYTSIVSTLLVAGVSDAIRSSRARIMYIPQNFLDHKAEAGPATLSEQVCTIEQYLPRPIDTIVYNTDAVLDRIDAKHGKGRYSVLPKDVGNLPTHKCIGENFYHPEDRMDIERLGHVLCPIIEGQP